MPYSTVDGRDIDAKDIPVPDLCRLCTHFLDPGTVPSPCDADSLTGDDVSEEAFQVVRCNLTRLDHLFLTERSRGPEEPSRPEAEDSAPPTEPAGGDSVDDGTTGDGRARRRRRSAPTPPPFTCGGFESRFGGSIPWH